MFSYYGSKSKIINHYPKPQHNKIIECFAGSARYSLKYFENNITIVDKDSNIIKIWKWLQECSEHDINGLPILKAGDSIKGIDFGCEGANLFMGFMVGRGLSRPQYKVSSYVASEKQYHFEFTYKRIKENLHKIKHWNILQADYVDLKNVEATWFIDPPYEFGGQNYRCNNKNINFEYLAAYCKDRKGQVIVCENTKATWLPFEPLIKQRGSLYTTTEAIWTNQHSIYDNVQLKIL